MLFLLKITITPLLVALMSLAAQRWGPTIGGLAMGLPWMTGPILFFLGLERGETFVAQACVGALIGSAGIGFYVMAYVRVARHGGWPLSLAAAVSAFVVVGYGVSKLALPLWLAGLAGAASLITAYLTLPAPAGASGPRHLPWWDIPMRMLATAAMVALITVSAGLLGPSLSGVMATYPVVLSVIGAFTHARWGWGAVIELARGVSLSLLSFVVFFLVAGAAIETLGLVTSFLAAAIAALGCSTAIIFVIRPAPRSKPRGRSSR